MEGRCGAQTNNGCPCRVKILNGQERCWMHTGQVCSVCFNSMFRVQVERTLPCGHTFHTRCLERWKRACTTQDPTCPMCREPFDVPTYRCRLIIEKVGEGESERTVRDFSTQNVASIIDGFGLDFRSIVPNGNGRFYTDVHFDINADEVLEDILRELGLPLN